VEEAAKKNRQLIAIGSEFSFCPCA
jgi:hypothetical protein